MRAFIDTSSLFKRYVAEQGSAEFETILSSIFEIVVSPVTLLEIHSIIERRLREKSLTADDAAWIEKEFMIDYSYFGMVPWGDELIETGIKVVRSHQLRVLDGIQLAAGIICKPDRFITSDKKMFEAAKKELNTVTFV